ncbi:DNA topoisomerase 4 subunit A [Leptolyngbya sp. FACHB-321]|uniref:DNA gyrase/topoisomerase IV subunit A n=1 Tax=Leptolyngbya sp. FACHB-321 TaxID=2692807 RepID=UPI0016836085|nr:DNA topoisomerase (ATP-hydrolyzing) [Leptolyngbya sp. FACHB-321]MBD2039070.1 DNA topoisomerase 4 subunit A [Leptolyngbya sp. FACHB-321]
MAVITTALHTEMQQSYLEYAMSVIVGRALPDVRDGLKPVHRRILYAMHELGLTPDRPYRKCARVVGDVLGKYHPHGDQAVYDALVRLVQDFSSRYPLLGGHGNFGSVDNDPPAAMRYTETRLASIGNEALLTEIGEATVDFVGNFDNSQQEPTVLPAQLPILLLNGSSGIAVGMATNIPPHNLGEIVDGLVALIDHPDLPNAKLFELIPGPDFPTGGEIIGTEGIQEAYATGKGSIPVRGVAQVEELQIGRGRHRRTALIVTELPYQVNKAAWIEKMAELVNQGRLEGIADLRDESDREGIRVVIELRRDVSPQKILNNLYRQTALQSNFGTIMLALADGQPRQMPLRELLQQFLGFREETLTRRYRHELTQAETRLHIVEGLLLALTNLDTVIDILRNAPDGSTAKMQFREQLDLSDRQADAILSMPLRRLIGTERQSLQTEFDELTARMRELQRLLGDRRELLKVLKKDLRSLKKKYADPRRTRIIANGSRESGVGNRESGGKSQQLELGEQLTIDSPPLDTDAPPHEAEVEETVVELTQRGYIRRITPKVFQRSQQKAVDKPTQVLDESDDFVAQTEFAITGQTLVVLTRSGKAYPLSISDVPQVAGKSRGVPLVTLLPPSAQSDPASVIGCFVLPETLEDTALLLVTQQGRIKRLPLAELGELTGRGLTVLKLKPDDQLAYINLTEVGDQLVLATAGGRLLRLVVNDEQLPLLSRVAQGNLAIRLRKQEKLVGYTLIYQGDDLLLLSEQGYAKRLAIGTLRLSTVGDLGTQSVRFTNKTDALAGMVAVTPDTAATLLTSTHRMARLVGSEVPLKGRDDPGDRLLQLDSDERIMSLTLPKLPLSALEEDITEL